MPACPQCQRPVAIARPQCLYCGAKLDPALVPAVSEPVEEAAAGPLDNRSLVLVDLSRATSAAVIEGLGTMPFDAEQRLRRGGWQVHRLLAPAEAEQEAARLRQHGLEACTIDETPLAAASRPILAEGGRHVASGLELRAEGAFLHVAAGDVLLVIGGTIQRERQAEAPNPRGVRAPRRFAPTPGYRFHIHRRREPRPIEIDAEAFAFDEPLLVPMATLSELRGWLEELARPRGIDDGFRLVPPALGVAAPPEMRDPARLFDRTRPEDPKAVKTLDNLAQFRFYSGWRGAIERRLHPDAG